METNFNPYLALTMSNISEEPPFPEIHEEHTKEECYSLVRNCAEILERAAVGPYTLFRFKQDANSIARSGGKWEDYYGLCAKYLEFNVYKKNNRKRIY